MDESALSEDCSLPPPPSYPYHVQMALPGGGHISMPLDSSSGVCSSPDPSQTNSLGGQDVLSVSAGEPVTHFNLDQLLEIVQSFQLDTSQASSQEAAGSKGTQGQYWALETTLPGALREKAPDNKAGQV